MLYPNFFFILMYMFSYLSKLSIAEYLPFYLDGDASLLLGEEGVCVSDRLVVFGP